MNTLPPPAREFMSSPATLAGATALAPLDGVVLTELVKALVEQNAVLHLEAMAESDLPKNIRKVARYSAYQLRSRGVVAPVQSRVATLSGPVVPPDLTSAAIALLPGLYGRFWLFLGPLPGVSAIEVEGETHGTLKRVEAVSGVAPTRLAKLVHKIGQAGKGVADPRIVGADLALRLLDHLEALIRLPGHPDERGLPGSWPNVLLWKEAALKLGADPMRASARAVLGPVEDRQQRLVSSAELLRMPLSGAHAPPTWIAEAILSDVMERAEGVFEGAVDVDAARSELLTEIALAHCDAFLGRSPHRERTALFLEASADGLCVLGEVEAAKSCLAVADALLAGMVPREVPLLAQAYLRMVDPEMLAKGRPT